MCGTFLKSVSGGQLKDFFASMSKQSRGCKLDPTKNFALDVLFWMH
jgi:hypothetical protein